MYRAPVGEIYWYPGSIWVSKISWWRHQMETFSALLAICAGNSPVPGEFPAQRPVTRSFDVLFDLRPNERLSKQWWSWWFETPSRPLWCHCNVISWHYKESSPSNARQATCPINYLHKERATPTMPSYFTKRHCLQISFCIRAWSSTKISPACMRAIHHVNTNENCPRKWTYHTDTRLSPRWHGLMVLM